MFHAEAFLLLSIFGSDPLTVGSAAPDFTLTDQDGKAVTLSSFRGSKNVVLVFYPMDETPGCTTQLCEFRDRWGDVTAKNTVVFGVNPGSAEKHQNFKKNRAFPFPLLVDTKMGVAKQYNSGGWFVPTRTVYLIGKDGKIRFAKRGKPEPQEVLKYAE
ncbi:peroxiredoxin [Bryobacterales bacterium F-183]|nr:peroxiredoxin [Bryobacterales bacterium F-183]